jgi:serine/threonine protein kinase
MQHINPLLEAKRPSTVLAPKTLKKILLGVKVVDLEKALNKVPLQTKDQRINELRTFLTNLKNDKKLYLTGDQHYYLALLIFKIEFNKEKKQSISLFSTPEETCIKELKKLFGKGVGILQKKFPDPAKFNLLFTVKERIASELTQRIRSPYSPDKKYDQLKKRPLIQTPKNITDEQLTEGGGLNIGETEMDAILQLIKAEKNNEGRIRKEQIQKKLNLEKKPFFSAEYKRNEKGVLIHLELIVEKAIAKGAFGKVKVMMTPGEFRQTPWDVLKIQDEEYLKTNNYNADDELKIAQEEKLAKFSVNRQSVKYKKDKPGKDQEGKDQEGKDQHEMTMEWLPGETLDDAVYGSPKHGVMPRQIPLVYLIEILKNILKAVIEFHQKGYFHRDLKEINFMLHWVATRLIDFGLARKQNQCDDVHPFPPGTFWYRHKKIFGEKSIYDYSTELYAIGVMFAQILQFIPDITVQEEKWKDLRDDFMRQGGVSLYPENDPRLIENPVVKDPIVRAELLKLVRKMCDMDLNVDSDYFKRCVLELDRIQKIAAAKEPVQVAVIDLQEFVSLDVKAQEKFIKKIKENNILVIQLIDSGKRRITPKQETQAQWLLDRDRMAMIHPQVLHVAKDLSNVQQRLKEEADKDKKFEYHFMTTKPTWGCKPTQFAAESKDESVKFDVMMVDVDKKPNLYVTTTKLERLPSADDFSPDDDSSPDEDSLKTSSEESEIESALSPIRYSS